MVMRASLEASGQAAILTRCVARTSVRQGIARSDGIRTRKIRGRCRRTRRSPDRTELYRLLVKKPDYLQSAAVRPCTCNRYSPRNLIRARWSGIHIDGSGRVRRLLHMTTEPPQVMPRADPPD